MCQRIIKKMSEDRFLNHLAFMIHEFDRLFLIKTASPSLLEAFTDMNKNTFMQALDIYAHNVSTEPLNHQYVKIKEFLDTLPETRSSLLMHGWLKEYYRV